MHPRPWLLSLLVFYYLCSTLPIPASEALPRLSLTQAVATALENHPSLKRLVEETEAAKAQEGVAVSGFLPQITLEASARKGPSSAPGFGFSGLANSPPGQNTR